MAKLLQGDRIGKQAKIVAGCCATLFEPTNPPTKDSQKEDTQKEDTQKERLLLTRRTDNGRWCLPGGRVDPGETIVETCVREMLEETGLHVQVQRLLGVYSNPNYQKTGFKTPSL
jgi:ADP-ribose pyrophosphatase YjhB (NUDIX family)